MGHILDPRLIHLICRDCDQEYQILAVYADEDNGLCEKCDTHTELLKEPA